MGLSGWPQVHALLRRLLEDRVFKKAAVNDAELLDSLTKATKLHEAVVAVSGDDAGAAPPAALRSHLCRCVSGWVH